MKVLTEQPIRFATGGLVDPDEVNKAFLYAADALEDVSERRWQRTAVVLPYTVDCAVPYTQALSGDVLAYLFTAPWDCVVERGFLSGNITTGSTSALVVDVVDTVGGQIPAGCTSPFLSVGPVGPVAAEVFDRSAGSFRMLAGQTYQFSIKASPSFSTNRLDLILHLAVDRWASTPYPSFDPVLLTDANAADPGVVNGNKSALVIEAAKLTTVRGLSPMVCVKHNFNNATSVNALLFPIPRLRTPRAFQRVVRIDFVVVMATTAGTTVTCGLHNNGGTLLASAVANVAGVATATATTGPIAVVIDTTTTGITAIPTSDYSIRFSAGSAVNVLKAYATVWTEAR